MGEKSRKTRPRVCPPNHRDNHSCSPALRAGEHEKLSETDTPQRRRRRQAASTPHAKPYSSFSLLGMLFPIAAKAMATSGLIHPKKVKGPYCQADTPSMFSVNPAPVL